MTKIKLCGLFRPCDIETVNLLKPEYIGFVFAPGSKRYISFQRAAELKSLLDPGIKAVGVFTDEAPETVAELLKDQIIDMAQLHGNESGTYLNQLRSLTEKPLIKAFRIRSCLDIRAASVCDADYVLLDSGAGTGTVFNWDLIKELHRPYFLAGGLSPENVSSALKTLHPYAVDVSSGVETDGQKDKIKMTAFVQAVRKEGRS